ncbi:MAG: SIMPL domain-containing protein [Acidobacteriota bacterium]
MTLLRFAALATLATLPLAATAQSAPGPVLQIGSTNRTISVSASDHAEAAPDVADIHIGFTSYGPTLQAAYKTGSETSAAIIKALLAAGATHSDIQSQNQSVNRLSDYEMKQQKGQRFSVQQSWTVSVSPKDAALILDAAIQAGADQSGNINWRLKNSIALDAEAIHRATDRAHAMAASLASSMNVTLGKPLYATNNVEGSPIRPVYMMNAMAKMSTDSNTAPLTIEAQQIDRTATVQIIYAIE